MNIYPFIEAERAMPAGNVHRACLLLKVSRAAYYRWSQGMPSARALRDEELLTEILAVHKASRGTYGAPRIHRALRKRGRSVSRKRVARLMARRGLVGRARRRTKRTTIADPAAVVAADLVQRDFAPQHHAPDSVWCGDISYVRTHEGWTYLATVIDLASRRVVGLAMADHLRASLVTEALEDGAHAAPAGAWPHLPRRSRLSVHIGRSSAACSRRTGSPSPCPGRGSAGTTPSPRASSRR